MLFNSIEFLIFFPTVLILYFLLPHAYRWMLLLVASCLFYMFFIPQYILILFITIVIDYIAGIYIARSQGRRKKTYLVVSIISTCLVLFVFKYYNFFIDNFNTTATFLGQEMRLNNLDIILPIGLSFHTFQSLSYVVEVYRGNEKPEPHFGIYSLYVMFYPQLVAGPIERPQNMLYQFHEKHSFSYGNLSSGLKLMVWGFFKKVVIADNISMIVDACFAHHETLGFKWLLLGSYLFAIQIYCDFSGYSDIAIGAARTMGFKLMENFRNPYVATSIKEFWSRWHISLSTWFRDYLYIPMGGNRKSPARTNLNLFTVFSVSGFWHGANWTFVIWGALHGVYLIIENLLKKFTWFQNYLTTENRWIKLVGAIIVFQFVVVGWIFFRAPSAGVAVSMIGDILTLRSQTEDLPKALSGIHPISLQFKLALVALFLLLDQRISAIATGRNAKLSFVAKLLLFTFLAAFILLFGYWGDVEFIYFQF